MDLHLMSNRSPASVSVERIRKGHTVVLTQLQYLHIPVRTLSESVMATI